MTDHVTWKELLGATILFKERLDRLDPAHTQPYTLPRAAATPDRVAAFEERSGEPLPDGYRDFLLHADGWPGYYFRADLFGLPELSGGGHWRAAQELLRDYDTNDVLTDLGVGPDDVLPVCAGPPDLGGTLFLLVRAGRPGAGQVIWLDGEQIDRYDTFRDFVAAMLDYLRTEVDRLKDRAGAADG